MFQIQLVNMIDGSVTGHKAGCADLKKLKRQGHYVIDPMEFSSKREAWEDYNEDFLAEGEDSAWPIDWKPCSDHVPTA